MIEFGVRLENVLYRERPSAYAIIRKGAAAVAVLQTKKGFYLPGGGVERGEDFEAALKREILEELGFGTAISAKIGSAAQYLYGRSGHKYFRKIGHFYSAKLTERVCEPLNTDHQLLWCSEDESLAKLSHEFQAWAVRQAFVMDAPQ